jgi:hypothetical protein
VFICYGIPAVRRNPSSEVQVPVAAWRAGDTLAERWGVALRRLVGGKLPSYTAIG